MYFSSATSVQDTPEHVDRIHIAPNPDLGLCCLSDWLSSLRQVLLDGCHINVCGIRAVLGVIVAVNEAIGGVDSGDRLVEASSNSRRLSTSNKADREQPQE
jgi:hypothetical protein